MILKKCFELCKLIAEDHGLDPYQKHKVYFNHFPLKNGKRKINAFYDSIIVDKEGNEHPYMLIQYPAVRNEDMLVDFDFIYTIRPKTILQISSEANLKLKKEKCEICEGGGWHSEGIRYFYKEFYCEI